MRFLTIRAKVTLWYTVLMVALVSMMLGLLIVLSNETLLENQKAHLMTAMEDVIDDVREGDEIDYFEEGVYFLQYNSDGTYLRGRVPEDFSVQVKLKEGKMRKVKTANQSFYVYDRAVRSAYGETLWLRSVISETRADELSDVVLGTAFVLLLLFVLLASVAGYYLTKRAFRPVRKIQETAQQITESHALSMRIGLPEGRDEITKLAQTIDNMLEQLEHSFDREKQFTADASHELRTPTSVILNESEYVLSHVTDLEEAMESMEVINRQANRMTKLINQLLFFARAQEDKVKLQYEWVDVNATLEEMLADLKCMTQKPMHPIILINETKKNYYLDKGLFIRAVENLIQNAITYSEKLSPIEVKLFEEENNLVIAVKDEGIGIKEADQEKIWHRFYQADEARSQASGSMGLGLSMVKWIVRAHGGKVRVESIWQEGSTFYLYFPIRKEIF